MFYKATLPHRRVDQLNEPFELLLVYKRGKMATYDERLFSHGIRKKIHEARFLWLVRKLEKHLLPKKLNILELGCFNGRTLEYLPSDFSKYQGLDSNWEGGLDQAKSKYSDKRISFAFCLDSTGLQIDRNTNAFVCLETLEHLDQKTLEGYIAELKKRLPEGTKLFITVPNEIGLIFLVKKFVKLFLFKDHRASEYTAKEFFLQSLGMTDFIERNYNHKGFHWKKLRNLLEKHFELISTEGIHSPMMPVFLNFSVGFVLQQRSSK